MWHQVYNESRLVGINVEEKTIDELVRLLYCSKLELPIVYLGVPLGQPEKQILLRGDSKQNNKAIRELKGGIFILGDKVTLIQECLFNIPLYYLLFCKIPRVVERIEGYMVHLVKDREGKEGLSNELRDMLSIQEFKGIGNQESQIKTGQNNNLVSRLFFLFKQVIILNFGQINFCT